MPQLHRRLNAADFRRRGAGTPQLDLAPYTEILQGLSIGDGADVVLEPNEKQRVVKRRFSMAASQAGHALKWRTAAQGHLRFQLIPKNPAK
ncbi:MAG: hypothetical protein ACR2JY_10990 [Chloroflexota bacterium]